MPTSATELVANSAHLSPLELFEQLAQVGWTVCEPIPIAVLNADSADSAVKQYLAQNVQAAEYFVRAAIESDLDALLALERQCWLPEMRTDAATILQRIRSYPHGQRVLVFEGVVIGVIYTQRIASPERLVGVTQYTVDALHTQTGSVAQLLAINLAPEHQHRGWGDQLLEHILTYYALVPDVGQAVALTRCKKFDRAAGLTMAQYISQRNEAGVLADPVLRFHELHGATIVKVLPNYRPGDLANSGYGVLVQYSLIDRQRHELTSKTNSVGSIGLHAWLRASIADLLACTSDEIDSRAPLMDLGLDSADLLVLQERICAHTGSPVDAVFMFEHNTLERLCAAIEARQVNDRPVPQTLGIDRQYAHEPIAIIGMACRLPGDVDSPSELWQALLRQEVVVDRMPEGRWQWPADVDPQTTHAGIDCGGFLSDIAAFDAGFFRISPVEAQSMDPQQRLMLTLSWEVMEQAGYNPEQIRGSRTGVFVGASGSDYARLCAEPGQALDAHFGTGSSLAVLANRISHFHDLQGPSLVIDTACSSSLVAVHQAIQSIRRGESDQALVGGVHVMCHAASSLAYYQSGMLSKDGVCHTFDARANGYVRSEGAVMLWLKPLSHAQRDGDRIYATLLGSASMHGGQASGLTVPKPAGQASLLTAAWQDAGVSASDIGYLETHGTGTRLGDPIEIEGIVRARAQSGATSVCYLGALKANVGHLEAAAGIAGLLKTIFVLRHQQVPSNPGFESLNPRITLGDGLCIAGQVMDGSQSPIRFAGVSSFGSGGTNAHVVVGVGELREPEHPAPQVEPVDLILSARTPLALRCLIQRYIDWLETPAAKSVSMIELANALANGRYRFERQLILRAWDQQDWKQQLQRYVRASDPSEFSLPRISPDAYATSAALRLDLPTYPFEAARFWVPGRPIPQPVGKANHAASTYVPAWSRFDCRASLPLADIDQWICIGNVPSWVSGLSSDRWVSLSADMSASARQLALDQVDGKHLAVLVDVPFDVLVDQPEDAKWAIGACYEWVKRQLMTDDGKGFDITLITRGAFAQSDTDQISPVAAAIQGLFAVAANELPNCVIRCLDWPAQRQHSDDAPPSVPRHTGSQPLAWRHGQWWQRRFVAINPMPKPDAGFRQGGCYVLIGGAGGIGQELTQRIMTAFGARVVWVGRRPHQQVGEQPAYRTLNELGTLSYVQADATDGESLRAAMQRIKAEHSRIDGLFLLTVGDADLPLNQSDWAGVEQVLQSKLDATLNVCQVAQALQPDFLLLSSSVIALETPGGYAAYSTGGAFQDAVAHACVGRSAIAVKTINWGHWEVGTAQTLAQATKTRLQKQGVRPIQVTEAMHAIDVLWRIPDPQLACMAHLRPDTVWWVDTSPAKRRDFAESPSEPLGYVAPPISEQALEELGLSAAFANGAIDSAIAPLLAAILRDAGHDTVVPDFDRWLLATERWIRNIDYPLTTALAWQRWSQERNQLQAKSGTLPPALDLLERCLHALPSVLQGKRLATDVLFPEASMALVQPLYQDNPVSDYFNRLLADCLIHEITQRLTQSAGRLRILEVGAGTGGTTAHVLKALESVSEHVQEYRFTDVSKAFLFHAQTRFSHDYPYLSTAILDITQAPEQNLCQAFDVVLATNVLHATPDLQTTLINVRRLLKPGGVLLLNEINQVSLFAHVTFGLLSGWWLAQDSHRRLPDSPLLSTEHWRALLTERGFAPVAVLSPRADLLGQQVLCARSEGYPTESLSPTSQPDTDGQRLHSHQPALLEPSEDRDQYVRIARQVFADVLRMPLQDISLREPLRAYGLDSILIVQITARLKEFVPDVSSTLLFECQTLEEVAKRLADVAPRVSAPMTQPFALAEKQRLDEQAIQSTDPSPRRMDLPVGTDEPIAIIGMALRLPRADSVDEFWQLLSQGQDVVTTIPADRWSLQAHYLSDPDEAVAQGKSYCRFGAFLDDAKAFDPQFFNIAPKEAVCMDPQERLFLQTSWHALEDAGYSRDRLKASTNGEVGVFVGITRTGFDLYGPALRQGGQQIYPHTSFSSVANRLSYFLDIHGPSLPVDTMCSSSLTAVHQACQSIRAGECQMAIVGGVNIFLHPSSYASLSAMRMLSPDGQCRAFGAEANGFVPGEGVVCLVIKPLSKAMADGDRIDAVIRATGINHGGRTNGYTVPNPNAQAELIRSTLNRAGIDARDISYVEAHGTGTALGDPIEMTGLTQAFRADTQDNRFCRIGSVKTNIGHLEAAAGLAGLAKVVLQLKHQQLVPSLHASELNPAIDFDKTPFVVQQALTNWQRPEGRRQGGFEPIDRMGTVSSFGAGGANAFVVLQEHQSSTREPAVCQQGPVPIVFSARTQPQLKTLVSQFVADLRQLMARGPVDLRAVAYTLQVGRQAQEVRLGLIAQDIDHLQTMLLNFLDQGSTGTSAYFGKTREHRDVIEALDESTMQSTIRQWCEQSKFERLLTLWSKGLTVPWWQFYGTTGFWERPPLLRLSGYPFELVRCWFSDEETATEGMQREAVEPRAKGMVSQPVVSGVSTLPSTRPLRQTIQLSDPALTLSEPKAVETRAARPVVELSATAEPCTTPWRIHWDADIGVWRVGPAGDVRDCSLADLDQLLEALQRTVSASTEGVAIACFTLPWSASISGMEACQAAQSWCERLHALPIALIARIVGAVDQRVLWLAQCMDMVVTVGRTRLLTAEASNELGSSVVQARFGAQRDADTLGLVVADDAQFERFLSDWAGQVRLSEPQSFELLLQRLRQERHWTIEQGLPTPWRGVPDVQVSGARLASVLPSQRVDLSSRVVSLKKDNSGVWLLELHDQEAKNTSSQALVAGLTEAFDYVDASQACRVLVITGFDGYFACGGTQEGLLSIQAGESRFTDEQTYSRPLFCDVPVIAAMQGHGLGAGWALGLYADLAIYSASAHYQAPYMRYGFTPGAGSSAIFAQRLGHDLAFCVLLSAHSYRGVDLKALGMSAVVESTDDVLARALGVANQLALQTREALVAQKRASVSLLRAHLPSVFEVELALHDRTFVGQRHVIDRVNAHFTPSVSAMDKGADLLGLDQRGSRVPNATVLTSLKASLAHELYLSEHDISSNTPFIDLGLDSIVAVTWIKTLNQQFGTQLSATDVYSYPNIEALAAHIQSLAASTGQVVSHASAPRSQEPAAVNKTSISLSVPDDSSSLEGAVLQVLQQSLGEELLLPADAVEPDVPFVDLGLDSIVAVTWVKKINQQFNLGLKATDVYSYPNLRDLAALVSKQPRQVCPEDQDKNDVIGDRAPESTPEQAESVKADVAKPPSLAVAIVGMAGRFPASDSVPTLWEHILGQKDCVSEIPPTLWDIETYYSPDRMVPGKTVCRRMGYLSDRDCFDPLFFNISPSEAEVMDPQQRLFLESSWHCIEDAGYEPRSLAGSRCGVFVGCAVSDYHQGVPATQASAQALIGESVSILPARVSYFLDLQGPCVAVDTACSSSLVAFANACDSLISRQSDLALAGGVYLINRPDIQVKMSQAGMLSPDGTCFAFDARANGFVPGEGVGVVMLKRLEDAERDGDDIYAVVRGWGVNQDGKTNGITAPNRLSQARLEQSIYERFAINPEDIGLIEAHGTGTKLGDPIEVQALCDAFSVFTNREKFCAIGSIKSNIGHLATAAGITGVIKAALSVKHAVKPATIQHETLNPHIELDGTPFYINKSHETWESGSTRRMAAVSSFGFSGTNAHVVLQAAPSRPVVHVSEPQVVVLSAQTSQQLKGMVQGLLNWLDRQDLDLVSLADLAHTLQVGRSTFDQRAAFVVDSLALLQQSLARWLGDAESERPLVYGLAGSDMSDLAHAWVVGSHDALPGVSGAKRLAGVPGYVFLRERYWLQEAPAADRDGEILPWQPLEMAKQLDWQAALACFGGREIGFLGDDQSLQAGVIDLGRQLSGQLGSSTSIQFTAVSMPKFRGQLVMQFMAPSESLLEFEGTIWAVMRGHRSDAQIVRWHRQAQGRQNVRLISVDPGMSEQEAAQALWRHWLMLAQQDVWRNQHIHLQADRAWRLPDSMAKTVDDGSTSASQASLVTQRWQLAPLNPPVRWVCPGTALVLVNQETIRLGQAIRDARLCKRVVLVADESVPAGAVQNVMPLDDPNSVKMSAAILVDQYDDLSCFIDLSDVSSRTVTLDSSPDGKVVLYQTLIETAQPLRIIHMTRGLHAKTVGQMSAKGIHTSPLVAMLGSEYPNVQACTVDVDESVLIEPVAAIEVLRAELASQGGDSRVAYLEGKRHTLAFDVEPLSTHARTLEVDPEGLYVVSGGTRGIGLALANYLVDLGCRHLVLTGLSELPAPDEWASAMKRDDLAPAFKQKLAPLASLLERVESLRVVCGDLGDSAHLKQLTDTVLSSSIALRGVIHAAGRYPDFSVPGFVNKSLESMLPIWNAKTKGFEHLLELVRVTKPAFIVSITSAASMFPHLGKGASDYAMANGAVALYAQQWQKRLNETEVFAICWPDWLDAGVLTRLPASTVDRVRAIFEGMGMPLVSAAVGLSLFGSVFQKPDCGLRFVALVDQAKFRFALENLPKGNPVGRAAVAHSDEPANRFDEIQVHVDRWEAQRRSGGEITPAMVSAVIGPTDLAGLPAPLVGRIHRLLFASSSRSDPNDSATQWHAAIREAIMAVLKLKTLSDSKPLQDYGLDSISAMLLATRLEKALQMKVQPQWLIEYPTVDSLVDYLMRQSSGSPAVGA